MRRRDFLASSGAVVAGSLVPGLAWAQQELKFQAMPLGSIWYVFAASFTKHIEPALPAGSKVDVVARGGGIGNPILVNDKKADVAFANVCTSVWAMQGEEEIYKGKKYPDIRALLGGLNEIWIVGMLTEEYIKRPGNDTLEKALLSSQPPRVIMKPAGSTVPPATRMIFEGLGLGFDQYKAKGGQIIQVDVGQIPQMMRDGRADLYFESASPGHPATQEVSLTVPVRFVDLPDKSLAVLARNGMKIHPMPEVFKGQKGPTKAADFGTNIIVHKDMAEGIAYAITKAVLENRDAIVADHKSMAGFVAKDAGRVENVGIPLHPGALRYYKEKGWL
ncbi:MAG TPA: TAXI family TRAP transporter solute-binding subunit [Rhodospirillales bacterium]|nr:TAXI family TRAP transporter solute-binding subunit [Rhodospirillales bacterium]